MSKIIAILALIAVLVGGFLLWQKSQVKPVSTKITWEECVKDSQAVIMEIYPAKCSLSDGRYAIQPVSDNSSCIQNSDCVLVVQNSWSECSVRNVCEAADYSQNKWVAVNQDWYSANAISCPEDLKMCDQKPINTNYSASCVHEVCQKTQDDELTPEDVY